MGLDNRMDRWMDGWMDGWMGELRFNVIFNSIPVIHVSGRWWVDNERLCAMKLRLRLRRFHL